jgi:hypothetical protein
MNGRVFDYQLGRFLSVDPVVDGHGSQALNPYSYVGNNPLSGVDPTGYRKSCTTMTGSHIATCEEEKSETPAQAGPSTGGNGGARAGSAPGPAARETSEHGSSDHIAKQTLPGTTQTTGITTSNGQTYPGGAPSEWKVTVGGGDDEGSAAHLLGGVFGYAVGKLPGGAIVAKMVTFKYASGRLRPAIRRQFITGMGQGLMLAGIEELGESAGLGLLGGGMEALAPAALEGAPIVAGTGSVLTGISALGIADAGSKLAVGGQMVFSMRGPGNEGGEEEEPLRRRDATPGDAQFTSREEALAEALKRHGVDPGTVETQTMFGKNPNLKGPKGEPWEIVRGLDREGNMVEFQHHASGHRFMNNGTYELPHYHGPNGEHLTYGN